MEAYEKIKELVPHYNWTIQETEELAQQFYSEFAQGGYDVVVAETPNQDAFYRSFVKKRCLREATKQFRQAAREVPDFVDYLSGNEIDPAQNMMNVELDTEAKQLVHDLQNRLSVRDRKVVEMLIEDATRREIAKAIQCSLGTVQNIIGRLKEMPEIGQLKSVFA